MGEDGVQPKLEEQAGQEMLRLAQLCRMQGGRWVRAHVRREGLDDGGRQRDGGGKLDGRLHIRIRGSSLFATWWLSAGRNAEKGAAVRRSRGAS